MEGLLLETPAAHMAAVLIAWCASPACARTVAHLRTLMCESRAENMAMDEYSACRSPPLELHS